MKTWPTAAAIISETRIQKESSTTHEGGHKIVFLPIIVYKFTVDNREYGGGDTIDQLDDAESAQKMLEEYQEGREMTIFYNPDKPSDNIQNIQEHVQGPGLIKFGLGLIIFAIILEVTIRILVK